MFARLKKILQKPIKTKDRGQLLLTEDGKLPWGMNLVDIHGENKLYLSFKTEKSRRDAKKAISISDQLYKVVYEKRESI